MRTERCAEAKSRSNPRGRRDMLELRVVLIHVDTEALKLRVALIHEDGEIFHS